MTDGAMLPGTRTSESRGLYLDIEHAQRVLTARAEADRHRFVVRTLSAMSQPYVNLFWAALVALVLGDGL